MVHARSYRIKEAGLIINPASGRNLKEAPLVCALAAQAGLPFREGQRPSELEEATCEFLAKDKRLLLISGGDGTISAVLTACFKQKKVPALGILPGGTTNLIAWDVSRPKGQLKMLYAFLTGKAPSVTVRPVLRVRPFDIYSMFCGAGVLAEGVRRYNLRRKTLGLLGMRNALPVTFDLLKGLFLKKEFSNFLIEVEKLDEKPVTALITTLERVFLPLKPFFPKGCKALKIGLFGARLWPARFICASKIKLHTDMLAVDGEIVQNSSGFEIEVADEVLFYRW